MLINLNLMESKPPQNWTAADVVEWLGSLELAQYAAKFTDLAIDGLMLLAITEPDLEQDLGVSVRLHRFKILENIRKLQDPSRAGSTGSQGELHGVEEDSVYHIYSGELGESFLILKAIEGLLLNNTYVIGTGGASFGRHSASNDIVVGESYVSRKHCIINYSPDSNQFLLTDLGSTTGTFVLVAKPSPLVVDMMFQMGLSEFRVKCLRYDPYGKVVSADLEVFEGPAKSTSLTVNSEGLQIGRDQSVNSFSVRDDSQMSSVHAKIFEEEGVLYLTDLGSTNRTWRRLSAESEKSKPHHLVVGNVVKVGATVMIVQPPDLSKVQKKSERSQPEPASSEETACKICFTCESDAAFYPCGHMACESCARLCQNCPLCRRKINEIVKLYR
jgi:pSer/pThr/pTyr-binding forkhead associated (FHA) protein